LYYIVDRKGILFYIVERKGILYYIVERKGILYFIVERKGILYFIVERKGILYYIVLFSLFFFFENCAVCEIKWKNVVERDGQQMTKWRMPIACRIAKITDISFLLTYILYEYYKVIN
jgi:hypothetical protein